MNRLNRMTVLLAALALASINVASAAPREVTRQEAARRIGRRVFVANGSGAPLKMVDAMKDHALKRPGRTHVYHVATMVGQEHFTPEVTKKWHPHLFFVGSQNRAAATAGRATLHRASLYQLGRDIDSGRHTFDTAVVRVSKPKNGMVSLGTAGDLTIQAVRQVIKNGGKVIAEVNPNVPHTKGNRVRYKDLAYVVKGDLMLPEFNGFWPSPAETSIGRNIVKLIPKARRHTLQVGIGNALGGLGFALVERHQQGKGMRLGVWSEMATDLWVLPAMNPTWADPNVRRKKPIIKGVAQFSFLHGTNELYQYAHQNQDKMRIGSSVAVNDPKAFAKQKRPVAVNTCLQVDFSGNGNAERVVTGDGKNRIISFPGGQPDFMKGASMAKRGKAILALRSTAKNGEISTIVPTIRATRKEGNRTVPSITTPANHVDHIVTEWGSTKRLRGLPAGKRAYEVIRVSHPRFREGLARKALDSGTISKHQYSKLRRSVFHSLRRADPELRQQQQLDTVLDGALQQKLITQQQHRTIQQQWNHP